MCVAVIFVKVILGCQETAGLDGGVVPQCIERQDINVVDSVKTPTLGRLVGPGRDHSDERGTGYLYIKNGR